MRASRSGLAVALAFLSSFVAAQQSDQALAERVLGPQWKQLSRRAGMIFAGTVLNATAQTVAPQTAATDRIDPGTTPAVELSFRVDEAIAGVVGGRMVHASPDEQGPTLSDLLVSAESFGPYQPGGRIVGPGCSRLERAERV